MTKQTRKAAAGAVILAALVAESRLAAAADGSPSPPISAATAPRVRSSNPAIEALIRQAAERSSTFRGLVQIIDASDGIVYVEEGECRHGVRACLVTVHATGGGRLLRVTVNTGAADWDLMGSIGHELRHAVEVLGDPKVTSNTAMFYFYKRIGSRRETSFETKAAIDAGIKVRAEVRRESTAAQP